MKYFLDTEFVENGQTIDLISIALIAEDGRVFYAQNAMCDFKQASDWVWRNVFPHLTHFDMSGKRNCSKSGDADEKCWDKQNCPWSYRGKIRDSILEFCNIERYGKPEIWGYFADYDWVAFCQLFGRMVDLPKGFPMYCRDLKQLASSKNLMISCDGTHNAKSDAEWVKAQHFMVDSLDLDLPSDRIKQIRSLALSSRTTEAAVAAAATVAELVARKPKKCSKKANC